MSAPAGEMSVVQFAFLELYLPKRDSRLRGNDGVVVGGPFF
jgi:hypothetical protein